MRLLEIAHQISDVWKTWIQENPRLTDPTVVNNGYCAEFALEAVDSIPNMKIWSNSDKGFEHVFLEHNGKFYDAENLDGVSDYKQLKIWQRMADLYNVTIEEATSGAQPVSLQQLCQQYGFKYPPVKQPTNNN